MSYEDPMERMVKEALVKAGMTPQEPSNGLDFWVPELESYIEVKQFHSPRIADQMSRAGDIIVIQGRQAVEAFCKLLRREP